jgi:hypothetical protein
LVTTDIFESKRECEGQRAGERTPWKIDDASAIIILYGF